MPFAGTVQTIARYPVKSMRGEELASVEVGFSGLPGDRGFAFVQDGVHSPFPWLTAREHQGLVHYQPAWDDSEPRPKLHVLTPDGARLPIASPELLAGLEAASGRKLRLHSDHRGSQDIAYISIISRATINALAGASGVKPDHRRFRMNFTLDADVPPFGEQQWVGHTIRIGDALIAITEQDSRCAMITFDPETGESAPAMLKSAGELNGACAGVYGSVVRTGRVAVGDTVEIGIT
jgi:uncharacterized protein YcbX